MTLVMQSSATQQRIHFFDTLLDIFRQTNQASKINQVCEDNILGAFYRTANTMTQHKKPIELASAYLQFHISPVPRGCLDLSPEAQA